METFLSDLVSSNMQKRSFAVIENGSWAPNVDSLVRPALAKLNNNSIINVEKFTVKSSLKTFQLDALRKLAQAITNTIIE
jgi:flavorubredoxin